MNKSFEFFDELYNAHVVFYVGSFENGDKYFKNLCNVGLPHEKIGAQGFCGMLTDKEKENYIFMFWIIDVPKTVQEFIWIIHELNHLAFSILEKVGVEGEEAHCYYHGWLLKKFINMTKMKGLK